jgi:regulator of protease activity HflC (stomatin/prohibitin superfamily)
MESSLLKTRKFPIALLILATVFLFGFGFFWKNTLFFSLGELTLSMSLFLLLILVFFELKKRELEIPVKFKALIQRFHKADKKENAVNETASTVEETLPTVSDGLIEIQKKPVLVQSQTKKSLFLFVAEIAYILLFCGIAIWRILRMLTLMHSITTPRYGIIDAVLLLVFPGIALIYLNLIKGDTVNTKGDTVNIKGDTVTSDMLTLFSYVSFIYAALIAASSALGVNFLIVLPWLYCITSVYLVAALAFNILFSVLKNNVLSDFNYTLIPQILKAKSKKHDILDTDEVRLNFSLKSLYTLKYAVKILPGVLLCLGFVLFLSTTVFVVQPHQQALVYRLGTLNDSRPTLSPVVGEGVHFKLPWPIDKVDIYDVHRVNSMQIGYESPYSAHYLWTRAHEGGENTLLTGNGNELVAVNIKIMYTINDLYRYVINCTKPESVLSAAAYEALMLRTVDTTLDEFLSVDRNSLSASVADELSEFCTSNGLGLSVQQVVVESIHPPVDIADIYQRVVTALVIKNTMITRATTTAERRIIEAYQDRKTVVDNAFARKYNRISEAQKEMAVYYATMEAYNINPQCLELRKYLDTYEKIIGGNKVYVFSPGMEASISKSVIGKTNVIGVNNE